MDPWRVPLDEPISTDRPDFTEAASVVPRGHVQLEGGYTFTYDRTNARRTRDNTFPELLLRAGLMTDWELRIGWDGYSFSEEVFRAPNEVGRTRTFQEHEDAGTDMSVGFKWHILDQAGAVPEFSVIGAISLPTGAASKSSGDVDPEIKLVWSYELTERLGLAGNVNFATPSDDQGRIFQSAASVSMAYSVCDWLGTYVEYFGFFPDERDGECVHYINGGLTFPVTQNVQFDVRVGAGLNDKADDVFAGVGFAYRF